MHQADLLFASRHFRHYDLMLSLSEEFGTIGERAALGGQLCDPLACFPDLLPWGQGEVNALGWGGGVGFGGAQRRVVLGGMATA